MRRTAFWMHFPRNDEKKRAKSHKRNLFEDRYGQSLSFYWLSKLADQRCQPLVAALPLAENGDAVPRKKKGGDGISSPKSNLKVASCGNVASVNQKEEGKEEKEEELEEEEEATGSGIEIESHRSHSIAWNLPAEMVPLPTQTHTDYR